MDKQMQTFPFSPPVNLLEESKWLLRVTCFECTNSVFNITDESNSFSITIPGHWQIISDDKPFDELKKLWEIRSQNGIELHVEQVRKNGLILTNDYSFSSRDTFKNEIFKENKNCEKQWSWTSGI